MEAIDNLFDLFVKKLRDRYDSEQQQLESFPQLMEQASSMELRRVIGISIVRSREHMELLTDIFKQLHLDPLSELCEGSIGMIKEAWQLMQRTESLDVRDAAIITSIQHIHHYDIAGYGSLSAFAIALDLDEMAHQLHDMLNEEKIIDSLLKDMAVRSINKRATTEMDL